MPHLYRQEKIGEQIAAELSDLFRTRMKDPRVGFVSINRVEVSGDLRNAKVYVSVMGEEAEQKDTMRALSNATGFLRRELASRLDIRHTPELIFKLDKSIAEGGRILDLIRRVEEEDKQRQAELSAAEVDEQERQIQEVTTTEEALDKNNDK